MRSKRRWVGWCRAFSEASGDGKGRHERLLIGILKTGWSLSAGHREPAPILPLFSIPLSWKEFFHAAALCIPADFVPRGDGGPG